jgi:hypothetical protein
MDCRVRLQLTEALDGPNKWYCSEAYGHPVDDAELLLKYYIKSGGAEDFANRFDHAISGENRWYCSQFYHRDIRDPQILWDYYMSQIRVRGAGKPQRGEQRFG